MKFSQRFIGTKRFIFRAPLLLLLVVATVESWSPSPNSSRSSITKNNNNSNSNNNNNNIEEIPQSPFTRRQIFQQAAAVTTLVASSPSAAKAACLQGDLRPVCIGIYKVPLDDNILPYISTPEELHKFAPDLTYVPPIEYPKSFESAMATLRAQRTTADEIKQHVLAGKLEEAGIKVLSLLPQVAASSRRVFSDLQAKIRTSGIPNKNNKVIVDRVPTDSETTVEEMAIEMAENQMNCVNGYWGDCDITIGQGIRGELGVVTIAQLTILESLRDATCALDDYLVTAATLGSSNNGETAA